MLASKNWTDITLSQYQELKHLESIEDSFENDYEYLIQRISIIYDIDSENEIFHDITIEDIFDIIKSMKWLDKSPPLNSSQKNIKGLTFKNLNKIKIYEFIDLEKYGENFDENFHLIMAILFRYENENIWSHTQEEPYSYDIIERSKLFLDIPITHLYGLKEDYLTFKNLIVNSYPLNISRTREN